MKHPFETFMSWLYHKKWHYKRQCLQGLKTKVCDPETQDWQKTHNFEKTNYHVHNI